MLAGDLTASWSEFGGITTQLNHLAVVLGLSITDHAAISTTYDFRMRRAAQKMAKNRSARTDYFEFMSNMNKDNRAAVLRDFEARTDEVKKEKERQIDERKRNAGQDPRKDNGHEKR